MAFAYIPPLTYVSSIGGGGLPGVFLAHICAVTARRDAFTDALVLPADVYRGLFKFGVFNAVQSMCFDQVSALVATSSTTYSDRSSGHEWG